MTLIPAMKTRLAAPSDVVDISRIGELKGVKVSGRTVTIGAAHDACRGRGRRELKKVAPGVSDLASLIGDPHVRHKGTIGGSVANNDPAADYPAALLALDATIVTNRREIAADDFFTGLFETALEEGEIITAVRFTAPEQGATRNSPTRPHATRWPASSSPRHGQDVRVAVTGAGENGVFRSAEMEAALAQDVRCVGVGGDQRVGRRI